jgi:hypothetical protein
LPPTCGRYSALEDVIKPIAINPAPWDSFAALRDHFAAQYYWYLLQFLL